VEAVSQFIHCQAARAGVKFLERVKQIVRAVHSIPSTDVENEGEA
jgi:hypothetical protein